MRIHLSDHEVHRVENWEDRTVTVTHRVTASTDKGDFHKDFTYTICQLRRSFDPKRLHYHLNVSRNMVTRAAIEKEYGD